MPQGQRGDVAPLANRMSAACGRHHHESPIGKHPCKCGDIRFGNAIMHTAEVVCPSCFESFEVVCPPPEEMPAEVDYDCEICCRPMIIHFAAEGTFARGLAD